jgi:Acetyltransferase (GNAT) domain
VLSETPNALPEQAPEWLDAMVATGWYGDASRLYEFRDGRRFVLPLVRRRGLPGPGWFGSFPQAWGIGGLLGKDLDGTAVRAVLDDLRSLHAAQVTVRPDPLSASIWAQAACGSRLVSVPRRAHVLDLSGGKETVRERFHPSTRRALRVAERKGVTVETDRHGRLLPVYYELFLRSVDRWAAHQGEPRPLAQWRARRRDPIEKLHTIADHMNGQMSVSIAFVDGAPAAGVIVLFGRTAHYTRGAMDRDIAAPARASHLLQWVSISAACDAGCSTYHMGESGNSESLGTFKERFGAVAVPYDEYRIERIPLSRADSAVRRTVKTVLRFRDV